MTDSTRPDLGISQITRINALSVPESFSILNSGPNGLTQEEAVKRLQRYGHNVITEVKGKPLWIRFLANFTHLMAILLWVGGIVGFLAQLPQIGIAIWMVNIINGAFSFWQEFKAEKATEALRQLLPSYARALRDGEVQRILVDELVPGDVILLEEGDRISADGRLVEENEMRVDQSTLSGESHPVRKISEAVLREDLTRTELPNIIYAGTTVAAGTGRALIFATGMETEFGKIAHLTQTVGEELSPLQKEMGRVTKVVTILATSIGVFFFHPRHPGGRRGPGREFYFCHGDDRSLCSRRDVADGYAFSGDGCPTYGP
jgi:magnesium-transporting ATPase (P-type)